MKMYLDIHASDKISKTPKRCFMRNGKPVSMCNPTAYQFIRAAISARRAWARQYDAAYLQNCFEFACRLKAREAHVAAREAKLARNEAADLLPHDVGES